MYQVPDWTDEFEVAMRTADPSAPRDSWKLTEGFVAAEGFEPSSVYVTIGFLFSIFQVKIFCLTLQSLDLILLRRKLHFYSPVTSRYFHFIRIILGNLLSS